MSFMHASGQYSRYWLQQKDRNNMSICTTNATSFFAIFENSIFTSTLIMCCDTRGTRPCRVVKILGTSVYWNSYTLTNQDMAPARHTCVDLWPSTYWTALYSSSCIHTTVQYVCMQYPSRVSTEYHAIDGKYTLSIIFPANTSIVYTISQRILRNENDHLTSHYGGNRMVLKVVKNDISPTLT